MKIAIIGAGVVGVTTAYMLAKSGHEISVFDREPRAAMESSFANGGQLSYGFASPMGTPALLGKIPGILLGSDPAFRLPSVLSLDFMRWSAQFLGHCRSKQSLQDATALASLALRSGDVFKQIFSDVSFDFGHRNTHKLVLLKRDKDLRIAEGSADTSRREVLSWQECVDREPALNAYKGDAAGGVWIEGDEVGDAARFSEQMVTYCERAFGVEFVFNADVMDISEMRNGHRVIALSSGETRAFDAVVVCTGVAGTKLLRRVDIRLPIYPVMGYSLTAPLGKQPPDVAVTDASSKIVFSRIGEHIRIAGFADFGIASEERRRQRVQDLVQTVRTLIPDVADYSRITSTWIGARPATPSSLPIVRPSKAVGVYLNMGHGMFGWTLSAGAAQSLADIIGPATRSSRAASGGKT
ncbi:MAG: FAD-dependent oxidoreductase [Pseudomonadota bacterium]